jgi:DNA primase catalytic subunit
MSLMKLPFGMRASTLEERGQFYSRFNIKKARDWVGRKLVYAVIIGRHSDIFPEQYKNEKDEPLIIDEYHHLQDVKSEILRFLPEGVYYDRNFYKDFSLCHGRDLRNVWNWENFSGQELVFDLDPENVTCPIHGSLSERLAKGWGLGFCATAFKITRENTLHLYDALKERFTDVRIVFSGRGFHIHVFDTEARFLTRKERETIGVYYQRYGIDPWVTSGEMHLIRLPFSLNGTSSRVVKPLNVSKVIDFTPKQDALPSFLE